MTGIDDFNYPAFQKAKEELEAMGHTVKSPHEAPKLESWNEYMRYDIAMLLSCDSILLLPGWMNSKGASIEKTVSDSIGNKAYFLVNGVLNAL